MWKQIQPGHWRKQESKEEATTAIYVDGDTGRVQDDMKSADEKCMIRLSDELVWEGGEKEGLRTTLLAIWPEKFDVSIVSATWR